MVSTWRYWSFKELNLSRPRSPIMLVGMAAVIFAIRNWSQPVLLLMAGTYMLSGVVTRIGGLMRRLLRPTPRPNPETQIG
jgi:CDP-diacylglycerol--serine O-phosphatidyltransferase